VVRIVSGPDRAHSPLEHAPLETGTAAVGLLFAIGSFLIWGLFPVYFKQLETVPAVEVLAHRVVWSAFFTGALLTVLGRWRVVATGLASPRLIATLAFSAFVISLNWGVFIWAVANSRVLDSSLGYYINPLVSVLLGVVVLHERLGAAQWAAVALAGVAVGYEVLGLGEVPWISLTLACSFAAYGLIRKMARVDPLTGLFIETLIATPIALGYLMVVHIAGCGGFGSFGAAEDGRTMILLVMAGAVTALPLLLFVGAARRIRLSTLGVLQYIVPTGHFLIAVYVFGEPISHARLATFVCIWIALLIYSLQALRRNPGG
jgi:chloramphenicol-sensitive protein RarD